MLAETVRRAFGFLTDRKRDYQFAFRSPAGAMVLRDLAKFCRVTAPPWGSTPQDTARYVGRNEVWHRIMQHLNLTEEELFQVYTENRYPITKAGDDE